MTAPTLPAARRPRSHAVRYAHLAVVVMVALQLADSSVMHKPKHGAPGDAFFALHVTLGLGTVAAVVLLWLAVLLLGGRDATAVGALFPWFSPRRRRALRDEAYAAFALLRAWRLPGVERTAAALAPAVHGLGMLAVTALVATGALGWYGGLNPLLDLHEALVTPLWIYLGGHAGTALLHLLAGEDTISAMFLPWRRKP